MKIVSRYIPNDLPRPYSNNLNRFYVGKTPDLSKRFLEHDSGESTYTSTGMPSILIWTTTKTSLKEALSLEQKIKNLSK